MCMRTCACVCVCVCVCRYVCACVCARVYLCVCVYAFVRACMTLCVSEIRSSLLSVVHKMTLSRQPSIETPHGLILPLLQYSYTRAHTTGMEVMLKFESC